MEFVAAQIYERHPELRKMSVVFVPQFGFLVALSKQSVFGEQAIVLPPDFSHIFNQDEESFFKNQDVRILDAEIGDLDGLIKDTESLIVTELEDDILDTESDLRQTFQALAELDCILALAACASDLKFTRPKVVDHSNNNDMSSIIIKNGRHPLQEVTTESTYVPNDTYMTADTRLCIVTGPNFSGKSCFIQQVGVLVYMAQIGSFIPCDEATISITDKIFTRISTIETCAIPQSSFQQDLTRMATILRRSTPRSLVLIDEFGKGTSAKSGIAVLVAAIKKLSKVGCKVLCTTHFLEIFSLEQLKDGIDGIKAWQMAVHIPKSKDERAVPLFKIKEGVASSPAGLVCAQVAGLDSKIVSRAKEINRAVRQGKKVPPIAEARDHVPALSQKERNVLEYFYKVKSWEDAKDEELRELIQRVAQL